MWDCLKSIYNQENPTRRFHLEHEIAYHNQGNLSIQDYCSGFMSLWMEYIDIACANITSDILTGMQGIYKVSQRDQFLVKLRPGYETVCFNLMGRTPSPSLAICLNELLREEKRQLKLP